MPYLSWQKETVNLKKKSIKLLILKFRKKKTIKTNRVKFVAVTAFLKRTNRRKEIMR